MPRLFGRGGRKAQQPAAAPDTGPKMLRLFVAVELPPEVRRALVVTMEMLRNAANTDALRWARIDGIHLTLEFLGAVEEDRLDAVGAALRAGVRGCAPIDMTLLGLGSFGGRGQMRVVWLGVGGDGGALADLADRVAESLEPLGFERDERGFNAHLTLARVRDDAPPAVREHVHDMVMRFNAPEFPWFRVDRISLMQSTLTSGGSIYRSLATYPLEGTEEQAL